MTGTSTGFHTNTPDNSYRPTRTLDGGHLPTEIPEVSDTPRTLLHKILLNIAVGFLTLFSIAGFAYNAYALHIEYHLQNIIRKDLPNTPDDLVVIALNKEFGTVIGGTWLALIAFLVSLTFGGATVFFVNRDSEQDRSRVVYCFITGAFAAWFAAIFQMANVWDHVRGYEASFEKFEPENGILDYNTLYYGAIAHIAYAAALTVSLIFATVIIFRLHTRMRL